MKMYTIEQIGNMTEAESEAALSQRAKFFISNLSNALKEQTIEAFGKNSNGLWGDSKDTLSFKIKNLSSSVGEHFAREGNHQLNDVCRPTAGQHLATTTQKL